MWKDIAQALGLEPLEGEGGLFASTYHCPQSLNGQSIGSGIYYMLAEQGFSHLHQLSADEIYHFYKGDPVELLLLYPDGQSTVVILGQDILAGQQVQYLVPAGVWQGSRLLTGGTYALMGTTMSPGYTPECYQHATDIDALISLYPQQAKRIISLTGTAQHY